MKTTKQFLLLATAGIISVTNISAQTSSGKLLLSKGQKLQIDNNIKSVINQEMMGQAIDITIDAKLVHQLEVKDKKNQSYILSAMLSRVTTNGNAMGQIITYDSDKKEDAETTSGNAMKGILNVSKELEISDAAKVIVGVKKNEDSAAGGQMMDMVNNLTGGDGDATNGASAAFEVMPAGKKVGDSWSDSTITADLKTYYNYTFKSLTGNDAMLVITGKQITNKKMEQQGMEISVNMEASIAGEGIVDITTGILKSKTTLMDGTGSAEMMGQSIPVKTKVTTKTTVKSI